jgi:HJR/Mrr/RecB family endonuclease
MEKIQPVVYALMILTVLLFFSEIYVALTYFQYVIFQNGYFSLIDYPITVAFVTVFTGLVMLYLSWFIDYRHKDEPFFKSKFGIFILILFILGIILNEQFGYLGRLIFGLVIILSIIYFLNKYYVIIFQEPSDAAGQSHFIQQSKGLQNKITIPDIDKMEGIEFELVLQTLFQKMGYNVKLTSHTNDMGADLILSKSGERISVQAKNWSANVGNSAIQEVVGSLKVYNTQRGMVITSGNFTSQAISLAIHNHVELWNRDKLIEILDRYPINK